MGFGEITTAKPEEYPQEKNISPPWEGKGVGQYLLRKQDCRKSSPVRFLTTRRISAGVQPCLSPPTGTGHRRGWEKEKTAGG
jgi:hypothetical protein